MRVRYYQLHLDNDLDNLLHVESALTPEEAAAKFTAWLKSDEHEEERLEPNKRLDVRNWEGPACPHVLFEFEKEAFEVDINPEQTNSYPVDEVDIL